MFLVSHKLLLLLRHNKAAKGEHCYDRGVVQYTNKQIDAQQLPFLQVLQMFDQTNHPQSAALQAEAADCCFWHHHGQRVSLLFVGRRTTWYHRHSVVRKLRLMDRLEHSDVTLLQAGGTAETPVGMPRETLIAGVSNLRPPY